MLNLSLHLNKLWSKYFHSAKCNESAGTSFNYLWTFFKTISKNIQIIQNLFEFNIKSQICIFWFKCLFDQIEDAKGISPKAEGSNFIISESSSFVIFVDLRMHKCLYVCSAFCIWTRNFIVYNGVTKIFYNV